MSRRAHASAETKVNADNARKRFERTRSDADRGAPTGVSTVIRGRSKERPRTSGGNNGERACTNADSGLRSTRKATKGDREAEALESKDPSARLKRRHVGNGVNPNRKADEDRRAPWHGNDGTRVGNSPTAEPNRASRSVRMRKKEGQRSAGYGDKESA